MSSLSFEVLTVIHELGSGHALAYPAADPELAVYGDDDRVLDDLSRGLADHLSELAADRLAPFLDVSGELAWVSVELEGENVGPRRDSRIEFRLPMLKVPDGRNHWIKVLTVSPLLHGLTFHLRRREDLEDRAQDELRRALGADGEPGCRLLELMSQSDVRLDILRIQVDRPELSSAGAASTRRRKHRQDLDRRFLSSVGAFLDEPAHGYRQSRDKEERQLLALLNGKRRHSMVVVGESGVGKSSLIGALVDGDRKMLATSGTQLMAGQSMVGQLEERVQKVMAAAERLDVLLYFDNLEELLSDRGGRLGIAGMIRPWLEQERVRVVAEMEPSRLDALSRSHAGFFSLLHTVNLPALSAELTAKLLVARADAAKAPKGKSTRSGKASKTKSISTAVARFDDRRTVDAFVDLVTRYFPYGRLPGQAIQIADELAAGLGPSSEGDLPLLDGELIHRGLSEITGIPEMLLRDQEPLKLDTLRRGLQRDLIGQQEAVDRLSKALCSVKARLQPQGRPLSVLLFVGPTGVGKTQAARSLARLLYGAGGSGAGGSETSDAQGRDAQGGDAQGRIVRFDMSEYADAWSADRLIRGSAQEEGLLTRRIRRHPFSVLLLDEIEKAHDSVFDLLLQVFGEGRLSDAKGRTAYFHNCLIILTSNLGATERRSLRTGFSSAAPSSSRAFYEEQVQRHFRPELVNRLDRIIAFEPLSPEQLTRVAALQIEALGRRQGFEERGIRLRVDPEATAWLAAGSYQPENGARALRRHLQRRLVEPIAEWLSELGREGAEHDLVVSLDSDSGAGSVPESPGSPSRGESRIRRHGKLKLELVPSRDVAPREGDHSMKLLQKFRRRLKRGLHGGRLLQLREEIELVQGQIHQLSGKKQKHKRKQHQQQDGAELAALTQRFHRLTTAMQPLDQLLGEVEEAEELALVAYLAGEPLDVWTAPLPSWRRREWQAVPAALLALEPPRNTVTLLLDEPDGHRALDLWCPGLVPKAESLGWQLKGWPVEASKDALERPPISGDELVDRVLDAQRSFRGLVLEAQGPEAGSWLAVEGGLQRFKHIGPDADTTAHLRVRRLVFDSLAAELRPHLRALDAGRPVPVQELNAEAAERTYDFKAETVSLVDGTPLRVSPADYWRQLEVVVARVLMRFERFPELSRGKALWSSLFEAAAAKGRASKGGSRR